MFAAYIVTARDVFLFLVFRSSVDKVLFYFCDGTLFYTTCT
jgi:hypothetical protein